MINKFKLIGFNQVIMPDFHKSDRKRYTITRGDIIVNKVQCLQQVVFFI